MSNPSLTVAEIESYAQYFSEILSRFVAETDGQTPLGEFPKGGCHEASRLFGFFLLNKSFPTIKVTGKRGEGPDLAKHAWLEFANSSGSGIIDLTCIQFDDCKLPCPYVSLDTDWHSQNWEITEREDVSDLEPGNGMVPELAYLNDIRAGMREAE